MHHHFRRSLLVSGGVILCGFAAFGLIFYFVSGALTARSQAIVADRATIARRSADLEALAALKAAAPQAEAFRKKMDALLPVQDELIAFPQFMNTLARNYSLGMTFNFTSVPQPPAGTSPGSILFSAIVDGSAEHISGFVNEVETRTTRFLVAIDEINMTPQGGGFRADLKGRVFFRANET